MDLKHVICKDEQKKSVTLLLYGGIGSKIDGDYFAQEINYLGKEYDEITIRINSEGGSVLQGLSIFNSIMQCPAYTVCQIDGVAASMAGVIPFAANKITMNDFGRIMLHNPYIPGMAEGKMTKKEIKSLENLSGILVSLVSKRCKDQDVEKMLSEETWLTAKDAKKIGIVDEIINTEKFTEVEDMLSGIAASSITSDLYNQFITNKKEGKMKVIASMFNLTENASEVEVIAKIKDLQAENAAYKTKIQGLEKLAADLKAEREIALKAEVTTLVDNAIASGHFGKEQKEALIEMGIKTPEAFKTMVNSLKPITASITAAMGAGASAAVGDHEGGEKKDFLWLSKNDPEALAEMKATQPDLYKKLETEYEKKYC